MRAAVAKNVGLPVCVGFGPSKTLAKFVNKGGAKKHPSLGGVCDVDWYTPEQMDSLMASQHVTELWGVAGRTAKRLAELNIYTIRDLRDADPILIRKKFSVVLQRSVYELRGIDCIPLEAARTVRDQLIFSRSFSAPVTTIADMERVRIARDMHDVVAHSLAVVIAQADGARYAAAQNPAAATDALSTISTTARAALSDVRLLLQQLRHSQADGPQPTLADIESLYAQVRAAGVELETTVDSAPDAEPPASVQLALYRILQEALTNALRHGADRRVAVRFAWHPDRVDLTVRNRLGDTPPSSSPGHGVIGMRERAQLAGGTLSAQPESRDFVVRATLPIGAPA